MQHVLVVVLFTYESWNNHLLHELHRIIATRNILMHWHIIQVKITLNYSTNYFFFSFVSDSAAITQKLSTIVVKYTELWSYFCFLELIGCGSFVKLIDSRSYSVVDVFPIITFCKFNQNSSSGLWNILVTDTYTGPSLSAAVDNGVLTRIDSTPTELDLKCARFPLLAAVFISHLQRVN